ncbi:MAG: hypothetical protein Q9177_001879 [Variospora cf. flavescens]
MSLTSILTIGFFITFHVVSALSVPGNVFSTKNPRPFGISRPGPDQVVHRFWAPQPFARGTESSSRISPEITGIAVGFPERSTELVPDRNLLVSTLLILHDIYDTRPNSSELATKYIYKTAPDDFVPNFTVVNISAVGRGREVGLPITFDNGALALFMRFLGEVTPRPSGPEGEGKAYKRVSFIFYFSWRTENETSESFPVAEGRFEALPRVVF